MREIALKHVLALLGILYIYAVALCSSTIAVVMKYSLFRHTKSNMLLKLYCALLQNTQFAISKPTDSGASGL